MTRSRLTPMKVPELSSIGGASEQGTSLVPGAGEEFGKKLAAYKQHMKAHTEAIKRHLARFIEKTTHPADGSCVTTALLELGFERQLDLHGEDDAQDLIERCFRRLVKERRGPLQ
jgi:hypothetical protein